MKTKLAPSLLLLMAVTMCPLAAPAQTAAAPTPQPAAEATIPRLRDPFWPVGFVPRGKQPTVVKTTASKELSDQEMAELIKREQDRIRNMIAEKGRIVRGNKVYVYIGSLLVTEGDVLEVDVDGVFYKLVIKSLSENNIRLEPIRQNKPK